MGNRTIASVVVTVSSAIVAATAPLGSAATLHSAAHHRARPPKIRAGHACAPAVALAAGDISQRVRIGRLRNAFGSSMFGIATGGGIQEESSGSVAADLGAYREVGARWLRIDINWASIQQSGPHSFAWGATDRVVRRARRCGMHVLGVLYYTPWWARPAGTSPSYAPDPGAYGRFALQAARHYRRMGVAAFEIWNEPNLAASFQPVPSTTHYTAMLKAAYHGIKRVDRHATVVTGGLAPSPTLGGNLSPVAFLHGIYGDGGRGWFDAVGAHPYCWPAFPGARHAWSAWYQMYGTRTSLRSVMARHHDRGKRIWATEFGAPTYGPAGSFVSVDTQARMVIRAYQVWASYRWAGPLFMYSGRDSGNNAGTDEDWYGLLSLTYGIKPSFNAYYAISRAFRTAFAARARH